MFGYLGGRTGRNQLYDCSCDMELDNPQGEILSSFDSITGKIILTVYSKVYFKSLWIQLEGTATARFQTKIDNRTTSNLKSKRFLPDESDDSGTVVYLVGRKPCYTWKDSERILLERGTHNFPFEIKLNGQELPSSFQSAYGRIQYKLVCHAISLRETYWHEVSAVEKLMKTKGYYNLMLNPQLLTPLIITRTKDRSIFSRRPIIKVKIELEQRGYLPGEQFSCLLSVENFTCEEITKIQMFLVQKIIYFNNKISKSTIVVLDEQTCNFETFDNEITWDFLITVPDNLMPTFSKERKTVEILYFLQFAIQGRVKCHLKGETPIVIGTTKEIIPELDKSISSVAVAAADEETNMDKSIQISSDCTWDAISIQTCSTLPPTYSKIGSRKPSLETLPPVYDIVGDENWELIDLELKPRPRSASNTM